MTQPSNPQLNDTDLELLSAYIDGQLSDTERAALVERLRREPALRTALDELRATVGLLRELEPLRPPRAFTIAPQAAPQRRSGLFDRLNLFSAAAALALTLLCVAVFTLRGALPSGGGLITSAPNNAASDRQELSMATAAIGGGAVATAAPLLASEATAAPAAAPADAAGVAEAPTGAAEQPTAAAPANAAPAIAAEATAAPDVVAGAAEQPTAGPQQADTSALATIAAAPTAASEAQPPSSPPLATSGSTAPGTGYLAPQSPPNAAPSNAVASPLALLGGPILILLGVLLLLVIGLIWARRRR